MQKHARLDTAVDLGEDRKLKRPFTFFSRLPAHRARRLALDALDAAHGVGSGPLRRHPRPLAVPGVREETTTFAYKDCRC